MKDLDHSLLVNILQQYVKDIEFYHQRFLETKGDEDLHQFRVNLRKSRALLKVFRKGFQSQKLLKKVIKNLAYIAKKSNKTRDMDTFLQACRDSFQPFVSMLPEEFYDDLKEEQLRLRDSLFCYLQSKEYKENFHSYKIFLLDLSKKSFSKKLDPLDDIIAEHLGKIESYYDKYKKHKESNYLHKIRIEFKSIRYILESFSEELDGSRYKKIKKKSKVLQNDLGEFHDLGIQKEIIQDYYENSPLKDSYTVEFEAFIEAIERKMAKLENEIEVELLHLGTSNNR